MYRKRLMSIAFTTLLLLGPVAAWGCGNPANMTHVGQLTAVDIGAKTFTIFDVQTASPITFVSDEPILKALQNVRGMVQVKYEHAGDKLKAVDVQY